jgi:ABC-type nitrate/sulfonate/bicarbonate transport system substrate-binding protein
MLHFNHLGLGSPEQGGRRWLTAHNEVARLRELISRNSAQFCAQPRGEDMKMRFTRPRRFGKTAVALGSLLSLGVLAGCGSSSSAGSTGSSGSKQLTTVSLATSPFIGQAISQVVGLDTGLCTPYGLKVNLVSVNNAGADSGQQNGSIQFGVFSSALPAISQGQGSNIDILAYLGAPPLNAGGIWGPPTVTSAKQLVGKTLAGLAGPVNALNTLLMSSKGIKSSQYSVVQFGNITAYSAAPVSGAVDAAWDVAPLPASWATKQFHNIIPLPTTDLYTQLVYLTGSKSYAQAHPTVVASFLKCYAAALRASRSTDTATRNKIAGELVKYDLVTQSEALQVLNAYPQSNALEPPGYNEADLGKFTSFLLAGASPNSARLQAALAPKYLNTAGVAIPPTNILGPTSW